MTGDVNPIKVAITMAINNARCFMTSPKGCGLVTAARYHCPKAFVWLYSPGSIGRATPEAEGPVHDASLRSGAGPHCDFRQRRRAVPHARHHPRSQSPPRHNDKNLLRDKLNMQKREKSVKKKKHRALLCSPLLLFFIFFFFFKKNNVFSFFLFFFLAPPYKIYSSGPP